MKTRQTVLMAHLHGCDALGQNVERRHKRGVSLSRCLARERDIGPSSLLLNVSLIELSSVFKASAI